MTRTAHVLDFEVRRSGKVLVMNDGLSMIASEKGLATLVTTGTKALQAIRTASDGKI